MDLIRQLLMGLRTILLEGGQQLDVEGVESDDFSCVLAGKLAASLGRTDAARQSWMEVCTAMDQRLLKAHSLSILAYNCNHHCK